MFEIMLIMIYAPTFVVQARHDKMINTDSANIIYNAIESPVKEIKWYEESGHVITFDKERRTDCMKMYYAVFRRLRLE